MLRGNLMHYDAKLLCLREAAKRLFRVIIHTRYVSVKSREWALRIRNQRRGSRIHVVNTGRLFRDIG